MPYTVDNTAFPVGTLISSFSLPDYDDIYEEEGPTLSNSISITYISLLRLSFFGMVNSFYIGGLLLEANDSYLTTTGGLDFTIFVLTSSIMTCSGSSIISLGSSTI